MNVTLEHANITVKNVDSICDFLRTAFPHWVLRGEGMNAEGRWVHFGDEHTYVALTQASAASAEPRSPYAAVPGMNHLGFKVDNVKELYARLLGAGYTDSTYPNEHPHRSRVYFHDPEGNDWEFIEYFSEQVEERNDYDLAG